METVYSDTFIINCANPLRVFSNESFWLIRNLIEKKLLHICLFKNEALFTLLEQLKGGNDYDRFTRNQLLAWFSGNRLSQLSVTAAQFSTQSENLCSSIWLNADETGKTLLEEILSKQLLALLESDVIENRYSWLFKTINLPTLSLNPSFSWDSYLSEIAHFTNKIYVFDRYFYYNWKGSLTSLIGSFLAINPSLEIEIIGEFDFKSISYPFAKESLEQLFAEFPNQLKAYSIPSYKAKRFHDRFLMTDYCIIKSELGFPPTPVYETGKQSTPTLVGRYASDNEKWKTEYASWEDKVNTNCTLIELNAPKKIISKKKQ